MKSAFSLNRCLLATLIPAAVFGTAVVLAFSEIAAQYTICTKKAIVSKHFLEKRRIVICPSFILIVKKHFMKQLSVDSEETKPYKTQIAVIGRCPLFVNLT